MTLSSSATTLLESKPDLKVGLQSVLRSLDVGLEDELARYRRKKRLQGEDPLGLRSTSVRKAVKPVEEARTAIAQLTQRPGLGDKILGRAPESSAKSATAAVSAAAAPTLAPNAPASNSTAVPPGSSLVNLSPAEADRDADKTAPSSTQNVGQEAGQEVGQDFGLARAGEPDDYFASAAALLESLAQGDDPLPSAPRKGLSDKLLTPTGIGASMLLLLGSATAGYLMLHPESLSHLSLNELRATNTQETASLQTAPTAVDPELPPGAPDLSQKEFVDLTLSNLGRLSLQEQSVPAATTTLATGLSTTGLSTSGLPTVPLPTPAAGGQTPGATSSEPASGKRGLLSNLANAVAGVRPTTPATPAAPSALRMAPETPLPTVVPAPAARPAAESWAPEPAPLPAPPVYEAPDETPYAAPPAYEPEFEPGPAYESNESSSNLQSSTDSGTSGYGTFVVVMPYKSDLALSQVQQFAPDAYVRNTPSGAVIQVGIHDSAESANSVAEQLQREGLSAYVE